MCITVQAVVIAGVSTCVLWYNLASWSFNKYLSVYGLKGALERRVWIDYLSLFVFLVLVILWFGPARKLGPMVRQWIL